MLMHTLPNAVGKAVQLAFIPIHCMLEAGLQIAVCNRKRIIGM